MYLKEYEDMEIGDNDHHEIQGFIQEDDLLMKAALEQYEKDNTKV